MARYLITYLIGETETINANSLNLDSEGGQYVFHTEERTYAPVALIPQANVISIVRRDNETVDA